MVKQKVMPEEVSREEHQQVISRVNWSTAVSTGILIVAIFGAFWGLADPRADIKEIKANYLSLREYEVYSTKIKTELDDIKRHYENDVVTRKEHEAKWAANEIRLNGDAVRLDKLRNDIDKNFAAIVDRYSSKAKVEDLKKAEDAAIAELQKRADATALKLNEYVTKDSNNLLRDETTRRIESLERRQEELSNFLRNSKPQHDVSSK